VAASQCGIYSRIFGTFAQINCRHLSIWLSATHSLSFTPPRCGLRHRAPSPAASCAPSRNDGGRTRGVVVAGHGPRPMKRVGYQTTIGRCLNYVMQVTDSISAENGEFSPIRPTGRVPSWSSPSFEDNGLSPWNCELRLNCVPDHDVISASCPRHKMQYGNSAVGH